MKHYKNIDEYIESCPKEFQGLLEIFRNTIQKNAPKAEEAIRYGMPTFRLNDTNMVHFALFKKHVGFYPAPSGVVAFKKELAKYKTSKGAIQFPFGKPLPLNLITKIVKFRVKEIKSRL